MSAHFGVYGLILREGHVLLVRKVRGPYAGLLDLPGGTPDPDDTDNQATLAREIKEETGFDLEAISVWHDFQFLLTVDSKGQAIEFLHSGVWTIAQTSPLPRRPIKDVESPDTDGVVWIEVAGANMRAELSRLVQVVLSDAAQQGLFDV